MSFSLLKNRIFQAIKRWNFGQHFFGCQQSRLRPKKDTYCRAFFGILSVGDRVLLFYAANMGFESVILQDFTESTAQTCGFKQLILPMFVAWFLILVFWHCRKMIKHDHLISSWDVPACHVGLPEGSGQLLFFFLGTKKMDSPNTKRLFGWWFGTFGLFFHSVGNFIIPTDELSIIFQRGRYTTNQIG